MMEHGPMRAEEFEKIGRVLHWAFSPKKQTLGDKEYEDLKRLYDWNQEFRDMVDAALKGMGMVILDFHETGIFWKEEKPGGSPAKPMEWPYLNESKEMKAVEALIAFGIATTFYPRAEFLEESDEFAAPACTVEELHQSILQIGAMAAERSKDAADPSRNEVDARLVAAYQYLRDIPEVSETDGKRGRHRMTIRELIEKHLRIMRDKNRFFVQESRGWRPTPAYKNAVKLALEDPMVVELLNYSQKPSPKTES